VSTSTVILALVLGFGTGILSAVFGVGGGILFVPILLVLGLGQVEAEATSLLAIIPTAAVGAIRHHRKGRLDVRAALVLGLASIVGVEAGIQLATRLDETLLRRGFAVVLIVVAGQLAWRARRPDAVP